MTSFPYLRPCPFCHSKVEDDNVTLTETRVLLPGNTSYAMGYDVRCIECGASVSEETKDNVVARWNGVEPLDPSPEPDQDYDPDGANWLSCGTINASYDLEIDLLQEGHARHRFPGGLWVKGKPL